MKYFEHKYKISFHSEVAKFYGNIFENLTTLIIKVLKKTNDVIYENKKKVFINIRILKIYSYDKKS